MTDSPAPAQLPHDLVTAVDHVGVAVPDLDAALDFYRESLGWVNHHEEVNAEQGVREAMVGPADAPAGAALVQLLAPLDEDSTIAAFLGKRGPGLQQYAVRVRDLDALMAHLARVGTRVLYPEPKAGTAGSRINFIHPRDAGGVLLELVEPAR
ncbi:methylmalonyl-CoA epimerase [Corynebacterium sphenisci]|uniref:methylmalonyl-CoA epimerase n=1 Tax=Corynebacterium sphenisci TaxID=191493 RepID=UPI0026E03B18|nr:methylmalonyl-CoA epimerase [Corynebacterium sphenisci]MDO5731881.1 methylmalonyl-CoA epimerase [Corynebacterium sphenisci]